MSTVDVKLTHVFGLRPNIPGSIGYQNESTLVYPVGSNLVLYNIDQKSQKFVTGLDKSQNMTAMTLSPNRRYAAVAETANEKALITIYDLNSMRRKKTLTSDALTTREFTSLAFSPDSKYLAAQAGNPDWQLIYWSWEKSKQLAVIKSSNAQNNAVNQIGFNPKDSTQLSVVGNGFFRLYRYSENALKPFGISKIEPQNFLCHAWVSDERLVIGTDTGKWILLENGEPKAECDLITMFPRNATTGDGEEGSALAAVSSSSGAPAAGGAELAVRTDSTLRAPSMPTGAVAGGGGVAGLTGDDANQYSSHVTAIVASSKGFAVACGYGRIHWFEKTEDRDYYRRVREMRIPMDQSSADPSRSERQIMVHMAMSPSEENLVVCTDQHQIYFITIATAELAKSGDYSYLELLAQSFHSTQVLGLDMCYRKPLVATSSMDRSVRIWNYETRNMELYKEFAEEAYSIAFHPSGLYILVGFSDKLRLMNILIDDIRMFKEFPIRGCRECAFSNGGHLFAAVHTIVIQIYSTTSFENVMNLKGHNGKIRSIIWSADDSRLISCGMDGAVYEWDVTTGKRSSENVLKSCNYTGVAVSNDGLTSYVVGSDRKLKEINNSQILREVDSPDVTLTTVALSHSGRMLVCGTETGAVRAFKFPLTRPGEWQESLGHSQLITKMKISCNDDHLATIGEDGAVFIWRLHDKEGRSLKRDKEMNWAEEILITKSELEEKNSQMVELKTRVDELKTENEYQIRLKDMNYNEKIKELTEKFIQEMESLKTKNQVLKTEKDKEEAKHEEQLQEIMEKQSRELQDLESANSQKLMAEYEKYQSLQTNSQKMQEDYERQLHEMEISREQALQESTEYFETKMAEKTALIENLNKEIRDTTMEFEETKRLIEEDGDREILDNKIKYEEKLRNEREANSQLKGETGIMKKKFDSQKKEIDESKEEIKKYQAETQKLNSVIRNLEKDILGLKKEIQERDETIQDKEKRIYDLKKKNQELDKFKFVLDYKIKELKKQIEPRENDIKLCKEQIQEMESELERFHKENTQLELNINELKDKQKATEKELKIERTNTRDKEHQLRRFKTDLYNCIGFIQEPKALKESVVALYKKHIQEDIKGEAGMDADIQKEFARQREHLERSVASLRQKLSKDSEIHRADYVRIMQENVSLIKEINDLRRELKSARTHIHDLEASLGLHRNQGEGARQLLAAVAASKPNPIHEHDIEETGRMVETQNALISSLRDRIKAMEESESQRSNQQQATMAVVGGLNKNNFGSDEEGGVGMVADLEGSPLPRQLPPIEQQN